MTTTTITTRTTTYRHAADVLRAAQVHLAGSGADAADALAVLEHARGRAVHDALAAPAGLGWLVDAQLLGGAR